MVDSLPRDIGKTWVDPVPSGGSGSLLARDFCAIQFIKKLPHGSQATLGGEILTSPIWSHGRFFPFPTWSRSWSRLWGRANFWLWLKALAVEKLYRSPSSWKRRDSLHWGKLDALNRIMCLPWKLPKGCLKNLDVVWDSRLGTQLVLNIALAQRLSSNTWQMECYSESASLTQT